ncbi:iron export ABC transporter permease subunit FetB [Heliobacterium gestii]|uniref:Iron export ABC transporter permease subunit FetB n=1 Tax=Heliomicrobium gestii TaxID=2699 RepID=A0A845LCF8_HELGE|nr:iron export ABC transporter permease subunit FetB [Heliomicrobium gestii]MBM7866744.1 putative ABC transport system permease protein [Heliomicrobium gestii]MZP42175.1 iron export ABC transporter permease subunit FetB [Heliomicrobium gestii]
MSALALMLSLSFVAIALVVSYREQLGLEKDMLVGTIRAFIQLFAIGYVLQFIFDLRSLPGILSILAVMIAVAVQNASKRASALPRPTARLYLLGALALAEAITLGLLLSLGIVPLEPQFIIPLSGMIVGNAMVASGLTINRLQAELSSQKAQVLAALSLGATSRQAAGRAIKAAVKAGMSPTIDSMKTVGLVQLPGMMTGQIIAGASPVEAVKYQILIHLVLTGATAVASMAVGLSCYRPFFTAEHQLSRYYPGANQ